MRGKRKIRTNIKAKKSGKFFWDKEYANAEHLSISNEKSADLEKFIRYITREKLDYYLKENELVVDLGCGNGRNLIYLCNEYKLTGVGMDISNTAIIQAKKLSGELKIEYLARSISGTLPFEDESVSMVLDMMVSHYLNSDERNNLISEVSRILKPGGWLFFKTFLLDDDKHAERLLAERPSGDERTYIHPKIGVPEHVFTETEIKFMLSENFIIHKMLKSHGHLRKNAKRRNISVYAEKKY